LKVTFIIELEGGIKLPVSAECEKLADVKKLGTKLAALPGGANKLVPGIGEKKLLRIGFPKVHENGAKQPANSSKDA
jgi:hypothetical protein